jgi:hypothetical protein
MERSAIHLLRKRGKSLRAIAADRGGGRGASERPIFQASVAAQQNQIVPHPRLSAYASGLTA